MQHRDSTSFNIVEWDMLNSFGHHVASCCIMLYDVERSLISIKRFMQHHSTFLLFTCLNNKVALVWSRSSSLLHSCERSKSSFRQRQRVNWPKIRDHYSSQIFNLHNWSSHHTTCCIRLATQPNTIQQSWIQQCWMMSHSSLIVWIDRWSFSWINEETNGEMISWSVDSLELVYCNIYLLL